LNYFHFSDKEIYDWESLLVDNEQLNAELKKTREAVIDAMSLYNETVERLEADLSAERAACKEAEGLLEEMRRFESIRNGELLERCEKAEAAHKLAADLYAKTWPKLNKTEAELRRLSVALDESIKLQAHYAKLLNMLPSWCLRMCRCGHHEGYHNDRGECIQRHLCQCTGFTANHGAEASGES
jgi:hypothetical protein